jgi:cobyrinic acid a,c-diamide synthase
MQALLDLECSLEIPCPPKVHEATAVVRIGVARDRAFSFYYEDNLDLLRQHGAEIVPFSPLHDAELPAGLHALYLGGGYPELYASELSANERILAAIRAFAGPIYAECGGMIFLSRQITDTAGNIFPLAGVLPLAIEMTDKLVQFGYVTVELTQDCLLGRRGTTIRGHSFHYSRIANAPSLPTCYRVAYSLSRREEDEGYCAGNVLASYVHLHFRAAPHIARSFVEQVRRVKARELAPA